MLQDILLIIFPFLMVLWCSTSDSYTPSRNLVECWAALLSVHPQNQHSICLFLRDNPIKNQRLLFFFFPRWIVCFLMRKHLFIVTHHFGISAFHRLDLVEKRKQKDPPTRQHIWACRNMRMHFRSSDSSIKDDIDTKAFSRPTSTLLCPETEPKI